MAETNTSSDSVVDDPTHPYHSTAAVYGRKHFTVTEPSATQLASISLRSNHKVDLADRVKFRRLYPSKQAVLDNWSLDRINGEILQRSIRIPRPRAGEPKNSSSVATSGKRLLAHYDYLAEQLHWQEFYRRKQASASRGSDRDARPPERGGSPTSSAESRSPSDEDSSHSEEEDSSQSEEDDSVSEEEQTDPEEGSAHEPSDYEDGSAHEPSDYEEDSESSASGGTPGCWSSHPATGVAAVRRIDRVERSRSQAPQPSVVPSGFIAIPVPSAGENSAALPKSVPRREETALLRTPTETRAEHKVLNIHQHLEQLGRRERAKPAHTPRCRSAVILRGVTIQRINVTQLAPPALASGFILLVLAASAGTYPTTQQIQSTQGATSTAADVTTAATTRTVSPGQPACHGAVTPENPAR